MCSVCFQDEELDPSVLEVGGDERNFEREEELGKEDMVTEEQRERSPPNPIVPPPSPPAGDDSSDADLMHSPFDRISDDNESDTLVEDSDMDVDEESDMAW